MPDKVTSIMRYLHEHHALTERETQLIENILTVVETYPHLMQSAMLQELLAGIGLSKEEMESISLMKPPKLMEYPVEMAITRHYRTYVRVPIGADLNCIRSRAAMQVVDDQGLALSLDEEVDIELGDITIVGVDEDGAVEVDAE